jgi:hypothetical protein
MKYFFIIFFTFVIHTINAQSPLRTMGFFSKRISESSGLEVGKNLTFWTNNDSGDDAVLYHIDSNAKILNTVFIKNCKAFDIEELAQDDNFMYVGDFGNNKNARKELVIYKISLKDLYSKDTVIGEEIHFSYPDQTAFPPEKTMLNFDCEGFFAFNNSLYLFSKNRGVSSYSKLYKLPTQKGTYKAALIDSFNTGSWVTSADVSPDGKSVALMCGSHLNLFTDIKNDNFFKGKHHRISCTSTQKEALVFRDNHTLCFSDEKNDEFDGAIYELKIENLKSLENQYKLFSIQPYPGDEFIFVYYNGWYSQEGKIVIKDSTGKAIETEAVTFKPNYAGRNNIEKLPAGKYTIEFVIKDMIQVENFIAK